jgi:hypothetical protein
MVIRRRILAAQPIALFPRYFPSTYKLFIQRFNIYIHKGPA